MEQWQTWDIKEFVKVCNECLPPNFRVNRHYLKHYLGDKTTFNPDDLRFICGQTQADEFLAARIKTRREQEEIKEEKREAQRQCRAEDSKEWFKNNPNYLSNWEKANPGSKKKRDRRYYLKKRLRDGKMSEQKYEEEITKLERGNYDKT